MSIVHICSVEHETSRTFLPFTAETKNPFYRFWRFYQHFIMVWKEHPYFSHYYRSTTAYLEEIKRHTRSRYFYMIHPLSRANFCLEIFLILIYPVAFFYFPMNAAFYKYSHDPFYYYIEGWIPYVFIIEILLRFNIGRTRLKTKEIHMDHPYIIKSYLFSIKFVADLCGAIPVYHIVNHTDKNKIIYTCIILRFGKILRLKSFLFYLFKFAKVCKWNFDTGTGAVFILIVFFCHWSTCLYYGVPRIEKAFLQNLPFKSMSEYYEVGNTTGAHYIETSFRTIGMLLTARRDIRMRTPLPQKIICLFFTIFGKCMMLVLEVIFINYILRKGELQTKYSEILGQLNEYMKHKKLPLATRQRLLTFYEYKFQGRYVKEDKIQNILSERLKKEVNFYSSNKLVRNVELFEDIPTKVLSEILSNLKSELYLPNDVIVRAGSPVGGMYFISSGTVSITTVSGREVCHLQDGGFFGEASLVLNQKKSTCNVTALEICEMFRLDAKTFQNSFKNHPYILSKLRAIAEKREKETEQFEREFQEKLFLKTYVSDRRPTFESIVTIMDREYSQDGL